MSITKCLLRTITIIICFLVVGCGLFTKAVPVNDFAAECFGNSNDKAKIVSSIEAANQKYKNKEIVLSGKVVSTNVVDSVPFIRFLEDKTQSNCKKYISAKFSNPMRDYRNLKEGDNIKVRCKYYEGKADYDFKKQDVYPNPERQRIRLEKYKNSYSIVLIIEEVL